MERESFKSRLGFILVAAGCAIGIGNVWRFPYVAGNNGGGIFVLFYIIFLVVLGIPVLTMELAVGRSSKKSIMGCYQELEKPGQKWHWYGFPAMIGNYLLMMFYTTVCGWMICYFFKFLTGTITAESSKAASDVFGNLLDAPLEMGFWMVLSVVLGCAVCALGVQNGVEKVTKIMMVALLVLITVLAVNSVALKGGMAGLVFYLKPDFNKMKEIGIINVIVAAMNQAFFTLSVGIGSMEIFGSYLGKEHTLLGESIRITILDTFVAITAGLIIFPASFAFGVNPDSGPSLIFITLPKIFGAMNGGRIWGTLFFLFMSFAALSTVIAVFENVIACCMDGFGISRIKAAVINGFILLAGSVPCVLGFNLLSGFQPMGAGSNVLDLEDFIVSNLLLPIGALVFLLFCVSKWGWGFDKYLEEVNQGSGLKMPRIMKYYMQFVLPLLIVVLLVLGLIK